MWDVMVWYGDQSHVWKRFYSGPSEAEARKTYERLCKEDDPNIKGVRLLQLIAEKIR